MSTATNRGVRTAVPTDEELVLLTRGPRAGGRSPGPARPPRRRNASLRGLVGTCPARNLPAQSRRTPPGGALAFVLAVAAYRIAPPGRPDPGRFRAFLWRVTRGRLRDSARGLLRAERRLRPCSGRRLGVGRPSRRGEGRPVRAATGRPGGAGRVGRGVGPTGRGAGGARRRGALALARAVRGPAAVALAAEAGLSRRRAGRVWRRLLAALRKALRRGRPLPSKSRPDAGRVAMTPGAEAFAAALALHRSGRRREAEWGLRELTASDPGHAPALHLLGLMAYEAGVVGDAVEWFGRAARAAPPTPSIGAAWGWHCKPPAASSRRRPSTGGRWS